MSLVIEKIDVYILKLDKHYQIRGDMAAPELFPGTDYYLESSLRQVSSLKTETCLIKLTTNRGLEGWGEAQAPIVPETAASIITRLLGPFVIGKDPLRNEVLVDGMSHLMEVRGHGSGFMLDAIAAIDLALWDLKGKYYGAPIFELLGGPYRTRLPAYVSGLRQPTLAEQCVAAREYRDQGIQGIKLFLGQGVEADVHTMRTIREAVGPAFRLQTDIMWKYGLAESKRLAREMEAVSMEWMEAPMAPYDLEGHRELARSTSVPLAIGETFRAVHEYMAWFKAQALAIAQPDIMRIGLTVGCKIAALALAFDKQLAPHVGVCTSIGTAAAWHFSASLSNFLIQEWQAQLFDSTNALLRKPLSVEGGYLVVPSDPGLGIEVDEAAVRRHAADHWEITASGIHHAA